MEATAVLKINEFKASNDLIDKFKSRHSIVFKTLQDEAGFIDVAIGKKMCYNKNYQNFYQIIFWALKGIFLI